MNPGNGKRETGNVDAVGSGVELRARCFPFPASRFPVPEGFDQMREVHLEVGEKGRLRSRPCDLLEVDVVREHRLFEQRPRSTMSPPGLTTTEPPGNPFPPS